MGKRLLNKVAVVTGSSSGLGRAIALAYSREGASVVCADLRPAARSEVSEETNATTHDLIKQEGGKAIFVQTDVTNSQQMQALISSAVEAFGRLDVLVNNAGISAEASVGPVPIHETADDTWHKTIAVNTTSVFYGCKYATAQMLKQEPFDSSGDRGWIINMSSIFGLVGFQRIPAYAASKGAVTNLTRQVALDYAKDRIHCNAICPGFVKTAIYADTSRHVGDPNLLDRLHPFGGVGSPDDVAKAAVVLASDDASWISGANLSVDGCYAAQ